MGEILGLIPLTLLGRLTGPCPNPAAGPKQEMKIAAAGHLDGGGRNVKKGEGLS